MIRPRYSAEFKGDAASLVLSQGYSISEASQAVGVGETAMRRWVEQLNEERQGRTPKGKAITAEHQRIQELESRIKRIERENEILKKATALLMSDSIKHII